MTGTVVAVGAGQASAQFARTLRRRGFDGRVVLVGDEPHRPYQRPPLSKEYQAGDEDDLWLLPEKWCADKDVELVLGTAVTDLELSTRTVSLADGRRLTADAVLIATGGRPRRMPGVEGDRVLYLRTLDDAERIRSLIEPGGRVVVIGAGFIGSELAAAARARGAEVTLLEMLDVPLQRVLGAELGAVCAQLHRREGVDLRVGTGVESVTQEGDRVLVRTTGGDVVEGDLVVIGIGIVPNVELAERAGLATDNGILVDERLRTAAEGVYAAGDVANHFHPVFGRRLRVEHFDNANRQGTVAADNVVGRDAVFDDPHWFWSDQYDFNIQVAGRIDDSLRLILRGDLEGDSFTALFLSDKIVEGVLTVNRGADMAVGRRLVGRRAVVNLAAAGDVQVPLRSLI